MKFYLGTVYVLLLAMFGVLLHFNTPFEQALACFFFGAALAQVPVIINGWYNPDDS